MKLFYIFSLLAITINIFYKIWKDDEDFIYVMPAAICLWIVFLKGGVDSV